MLRTLFKDAYLVRFAFFCTRMLCVDDYVEMGMWERAGFGVIVITSLDPRASPLVGQ